MAYTYGMSARRFPLTFFPSNRRQWLTISLVALIIAVHLVLIDMHMPRLTGLEAIARIKQVQATLPCILISGQVDESMRRSADAFRVLTKPISFRLVTETVHEALRAAYDWEQEAGGL